MRRLLCAGVVLAGVMALTACKVDDTGSAQQAGGAEQVAQQGNPAQGGQQGGGPGGGQNGTPRPRPTIDPTLVATNQDLNRYAVGMLYLADTGHPLTKDQAVKLLPLWQDIQTAMRPPDQSQTETAQPPAQGQDQTPGAGQRQFGGGRGFGFAFDAPKIEGDLANIKAALTQEQVSDINSLTQDQMTSILQKNDINFGFGFAGSGGRNGNGSGNGGFPGGGNFQGTPGAFATARAEGTFPARATPDANQLATFQARPSPDANQLATAQARRAEGNPLVAAVVKSLQTLAGG